MADPHRQDRHDRLTDDLVRLTGKPPTRVQDFVRLHAGEFTRLVEDRQLHRRQS